MRLPRSLLWRMTLAHALLLVLALGVVSVYLISFVRGTYLNDLEGTLEHEARLTAHSAARLLSASPDGSELQALAEDAGLAADARVTIVDPAGVVLADNQERAAEMANYRGRPEVAAALAGNVGRTTRESAASGERLLHKAVPIVTGGEPAGAVIVAASTAGVNSNINRIIWTVTIAGLVVTALALGLGAWIARRTVSSVRSVADGAARFANGDLDYRVPLQETSETRLLAEAFNRMADTVRSTIRDLSDEHAKLSAVLDTMGDGVALIAAPGGIDLVNSAARDLLSVDESGSGAPRLRDPDLLQLTRRAVQENTRQQRDVELVPGPRYISAIATPLDSSHVLLTLHDLTTVRQLDVTRREFVSNVSHELRNPLASMTAIVETLEGGAVADPEAAADFLARVRGDIERMNALVNDLLMLSRIESGRDELERVRVDVTELLEDARRGAATKRGPLARVVVETEQAPIALADPRRVRQVIDNLLDNALRFTPADGAVTLRSWTQEGSVHLSVSDTGPGIPQKHLPHLFERFYKADPSRHDPGTGLGLAIARHIVEAHGGRISVRSQLGHGSTFEATLPAAP